MKYSPRISSVPFSHSNPPTPAPAEQAAVLRNCLEERRYLESNALLLSFGVREMWNQRSPPSPGDQEDSGAGGRGTKGAVERAGGLGS